MDIEKIRKYWEGRAASDSSAQSTTQDYYLREIEFRVLRNVIGSRAPANVLDAGCGDARTTARLAAEFRDIRFVGGDYSESMIRNAKGVIEESQIGNLSVMLCNVSRPISMQPFDLIYSTRCLINLPTWELQQTAIRNLANALAAGGLYVMIENFIEGHENFNRVRNDFGLPQIPVREHNLFFQRDKLMDFVADLFEVVEEVNISSTYYLVSRTIYSKICLEAGIGTDYFDAHHKYAAQLPFAGEYGPVRMLCLRRK